MISGTGKVEDSMTLFRDGNNNGNIQAAPGSTEVLGTHLKRVYINPSSVRNKQDELETLIISLRYHWCQ